MLNRSTSIRVLLAAAAWTLLPAAAAVAQVLVPPTDSVDTPLMPAGISNDDAELSGSLLYLWQQGQTHVLHFNGDFALRLGPRRLMAREAVLWMTPQKFEDRSCHYLDIFLWQDARIVDPGGAATSGPALFATVATFGQIRLQADHKTFQDDSASQVYQDADKIRSSFSPLLQGQPPIGAPPSPLTVIELTAKAKPTTRRSFGPGVQAQRAGGEVVWVAMPNFHLSQGVPGEPDSIEVRADAGVFFTRDPSAPKPEAPEDQPQSAPGGFDPADAKGVYLEGDVVLMQGDRLVRADRVYYDLEHSRALILDPVMRVYLEGRNLPLYVRAVEARQLSVAEFSATGAKVSTSDFYTPHYHIGAEKLYFTTETAPGVTQTMPGTRTGQYSMTHTTFNVEGVPLFYWPFAEGNFQEGDNPLRGLRIGNDNDFGFSVESSWNFFTLLGMTKPEIVRDAILDLDYFSDRGLGVGLRSKLESENSYGEFRGYYIYDQEDRDHFTDQREPEIDHPNRGRATWRHRFYLPSDWELTLEASYISDANFLEQYFENEFDNDKPQETYFQLKKQRDNWALTILAQARILDWLDQTESLPDVAFRLTGEAVGPTTFFSENRMGLVRYRPDERRLFLSADNNPGNEVRSGVVTRGDTRQELDLPFSLGPLKLVPFASGRGSFWDDSPHDGGVQRGFGTAGVRGSTYLSRVYEQVSSAFLDITGLRHIMKLDVTGWISGSNLSSSDLFPFQQDVEGIEDFSGATAGLRQRWQTRRGAADKQRIVDWLTLDLETAWFSNNEDDTAGYASWMRPEESISQNHAKGDFTWRLSDATAVLGDVNYDLDRGALGIANLSYAVEHTPRFSYFVGWRLIDDIESNLFGFGTNYRIDDKHAVGFRSYIDVDRGSTEKVDLTYVRRFPKWYLSLTFELDEIEDNTSVSVALWPEGFPNVALGSKRYTGLADSTAIRPPE